MIDIDNLPPVEDVRTWARELVARDPRALHDSYYYIDGLYIDSYADLGTGVQLAREQVGNPAQGGTYIVRRIQFATFPDHDFTEPPFFDGPNRTWSDIPLHNHRSRFVNFSSSQRTNEFKHSFERPTLVRVVKWYDYCREIREINVEVPSYTLYEFEPEHVRAVLAANAARAAREAEIRSRRPQPATPYLPAYRTNPRRRRS